MPLSIEDQVIDFYQEIFERIFSDRFRPRIEKRLKRNAVVRRIEESADAASRSLTRFFTNQQLGERQVADILSGFASIGSLVNIDDISNPNVTPEKIVAEDAPCPGSVTALPWRRHTSPASRPC